MQINILSDSLPNDGIFNRSVSRSRSKKCIIPNGIDRQEYINYPESELRRNPRLRYHVESVRNAFNMSDRKYSFFNLHGGVDSCRIFNDSHNELEKLGYQIYFTGKSVVLSMDNFLDIALMKCCKANPHTIRRIRDYDVMSFLFMNCALHRANETVYMSRFQGYDQNLDNYLNSCSAHFISDGETDEGDGAFGVLCKIYFGVFSAAADILINCVKVMCHKYNLAIRSQGFSNFVLSPQKQNVEIPSYIDYIDHDVEFRLPVLTLGRGEYLDVIRGES